MNKHQPLKRNRFELQEVNVEEGPQALANPMRNLRPLPNPQSFCKFSGAQHLINHPNREQVVHDIAFPHAMNS